MKGVNVAILVVLLCSLCDGQGRDWLGLDGLFKSLDNVNKEIEQSMEQLTQNIEKNVRNRLVEVGELTKNLNASVVQGSMNVINGNGNSKIITFGLTSDGQPYTRTVEESIDGDTLRHVVRVYNHKTNTTNESGYTLNLKDPNAKPVPIVNKS